jgi:hypothetical protein
MRFAATAQHARIAIPELTMRTPAAGVRCFIARGAGRHQRCAAAGAIAAPDLSGRWTGVSNNNVSQTFALERIEAKGESAFSARLTW